MNSANLAMVLAVAAIFTVACNKSGTGTTSQTKPAGTLTPAAASTATPDELASARSNFAKHCSVCHGNEGKGGPVRVENVNLKVPSLREGHALHHTDEEFVKQISNGGDGMPKFKDKLKPEEITDLVRFIHQEFQGGAAHVMKPMKMN
jgi:mono/diheme cytochrome c family protein